MNEIIPAARKLAREQGEKTKDRFSSSLVALDPQSLLTYIQNLVRSASPLLQSNSVSDIKQRTHAGVVRTQQEL